MSSVNAKKTDSPEIRRAEQEVKRNAHQFEKAMDQLQDKVEGTAERVDHLREIAQRPREVARDLMVEIRSRAKDANELIDENPVYTALGVTLVFGLLGLFLGMRRERYRREYFFDREAV